MNFESTSLIYQKTLLRKEIKFRIASLSSEQKIQLGQRICAQLIKNLTRKNFQTIAVFAPLKNEPDIWSVIEWLWKQQKTVLFPKIRHTNDGLDFFVVRGREELLQQHLGILEPDEKVARQIFSAEIEIALIPGVAFDQTGNRLGRSGGLYDRFLADLEFCGQTIGVCFPIQIVEKIPTEPHDQKVGRVILNKF